METPAQFLVVFVLLSSAIVLPLFGLIIIAIVQSRKEDKDVVQGYITSKKTYKLVGDNWGTDSSGCDSGSSTGDLIGGSGEHGGGGASGSWEGRSDIGGD